MEELGWFPKLTKIEKWCRDNCDGQYKITLLQRHPHRGFQMTSSAGSFDTTASVGVAPHCWLAFEHTHDAIMYRLVWGE
jgi:hypothetical protein